MQNILVHSRIKIYLTFNVEIRMNTISFLFVTNFYCTKSFSNFIFNSSKLNGSMEASIMKLLNFFESTFLCLCWNLPYLKLDLSKRTFWFILPCSDPFANCFGLCCKFYISQTILHFKLVWFNERCTHLQISYV